MHNRHVPKIWATGGRRTMNETYPDFLQLLRSTNFTGHYYALCDTFPLRLNVPASRSPAKEVVAALCSVAKINKCKGPGRVVEFAEEYPASGRLSFEIQGHGTSVEDFWSRLFSGAEIGDNFAVLAWNLTMMEGKDSIPDPHYPRSTFHSLVELQAILTDVLRLGRLLFSLPDERVDTPVRPPRE